MISKVARAVVVINFSRQARDSEIRPHFRFDWWASATFTYSGAGFVTIYITLMNKGLRNNIFKDENSLGAHKLFFHLEQPVFGTEGRKQKKITIFRFVHSVVRSDC